MTSKVALVTGGSRGLGRSIANRLAESGVNVLIAYRTDETLAENVVDELEKGGVNAGKVRLDVTDFDRYPAFVESVREELQESFGRSHLDYLVNNAGIAVFAPFVDAERHDFDQTFSVNVKAPYFLTKALLETLTNGSRVLNVSTAVARAVVPGLSVYAASKGAVEVLTRYLAVELAERGIRVNALVGGAIETDLGGGMMRADEVRAMAAQQIALGRMGQPDELAAAVPAILSDAFVWATGAMIEVTGGQAL
jgi:NAD(P)-dependent dehydrogenase (short-subunit alcohol dehydrogenase family)